MSKTLILRCPGTVTGTGHKKLENYVGIEFRRNSSDGGGVNGYVRMIGDEDLINTLPLFNEIKASIVKDAKIVNHLNQIHWDDNALKGNDGSDVMQTFPKMYGIIGGTNPDYERFIYSDTPFSYDGDEAEEIDAWAESVDFEVVVNGQSRCIIDAPNTILSTKTKNGRWINDISGVGYPSRSMTRYSFEAYARSKNQDSNSNFPYCNCNHFDYEVLLGILYVECRTKNLTGVFGYGISSNVTPNANTWGQVTGVHCTDEDIYLTFGTGVYGAGLDVGTVTTDSNRANLYDQINGATSFTKIMEAQRAVSADNSLLEAVFNSEGVQLDGIDKGVMTGIYTFCVNGVKMNCAFASGETVAEHTFDFVFRVPLWRGRVLDMGNIWEHRSGYDVLNYKDSDNNVHNVLYRANSMSEMLIESAPATEVLDSKEEHLFTQKYTEICDMGPVVGWSKDTPTINGRSLTIGVNGGAAPNNYQCAYTYCEPTAVDGKFSRKTAAPGGAANNSAVAPRNVLANCSPSLANASFGSRFRCRLNK